jgi:superfamily II DNA or RNA helicase
VIQLRDYQEQAIHDLRQAMKKHKNVLLTAPTGAGKTALAVFMMGTAKERGLRSFFLVHQNELLKQTSKALWKQKLEHGIIASGKRVSKMEVQVASVQTLVRRLDKYEEPALIIVDESHLGVAASYLKIFEQFPNARIIGLTATPQRTDGKALGDVFDTIVEGPSVRMLIDRGYLSDYRLIAPRNVLDMSDVKTKGGDYDIKATEEKLDKPTITGDAVAAYKQHANGKRCVVLCVSIAHAEHVCESYRAAGVAAEAIHGGHTEAEREAKLERLESGETLVLTSVQLMIAGVDIPAIEVVQFLRPTQSLVIYMQAIGRGLRPAPGKDKLIILDQVSNWTRHGLPDEKREWSLEGKKSRKKKDDEDADIAAQQCPSCFAVFRKGPDACPVCGHELPKKSKAELEVVDGELTEIDVDAIRRERKKQQGSARTLTDLIKLGIQRGIKNPSGWAANVAAARVGKKPTAQDFADAKRIYQELRNVKSRNQNSNPSHADAF